MTHPLRDFLLGTFLATAVAAAAVGGCSSDTNNKFHSGSSKAGHAGSGGAHLGGNPQGGNGEGASNMGPGGSGGSGGGLNTGGAGGIDLSGCATDEYTGQIVPLDMYLLLDKSGSMSSSATDGGPGKWPQITGAIKDFLKLPGTNGIGMALGFFPIRPRSPVPSKCTTAKDCYPYDDQCIPSFNGGMCPSSVSPDESCVGQDYSYPAVPMEPLPGVAPKIEGAIAQNKPGGSTPMAPALWGGMTYASWWAKQHPDHITIVVLATDGYPTSCVDNEITNVVQIAKGGLNSEGIRTFVIGIGQLDKLNQIAKAGGTEKAILVGQSGDPGADFLAALNKIRGSVGCVYHLPVPESGTPDPEMLNVAYTPEGGAQEIYPRVSSKADCGNDKGWYYDDPANPNKINLCPASCDQVQHTKGKVQVVIGCKSVVK